MTRLKAQTRIDHFHNLVTHWSHFGPPLRPSAADTRVIAQIARQLPGEARVVMLGVTPETAACGFQPGTRLLSLDHSLAMISALWGVEGAPASAHAVGADWGAMPLVSGLIDAVVGDGCYALFPYPSGYRALTREVHRVLRPGGKLAMRTYVRPEPAESVESIETAYRAGAISSVHALKLRLWAALHGASGEGACLADVWAAWRKFPRIDAIAEGRPGWSAGELEGIESYRSLRARYHLTTVSECHAVLLERFERVDWFWTDDESSDRSPTFVAHKGQRA